VIIFADNNWCALIVSYKLHESNITVLYFLNKDFWSNSFEVIALITILAAIVFLRYFAIAWLYKIILSVSSRSNRNDFGSKKTQIMKEIRWSFLSSLMFALLSALGLWAYQRGLTVIYDDVSAYPTWYLFSSPVLFLLLYETYYYWLHRWMHRPSIFKFVHKVHHESHRPTVFTSFSFHPLEAFLQFLFFPLVVFVIPFHYMVLLTVLMILTLSAVINHSGVEIFRKKFLTRHLIGSTHHDLHHTEFQTNFGLYLTWWDRLMKTGSKKNDH